MPELTCLNDGRGDPPPALNTSDANEPGAVAPDHPAHRGAARNGAAGELHMRNLDRWMSLIDRGDVQGSAVLTGLDRDSIEMREVSPMGGLLSQDERNGRAPDGQLMRRDQLEHAIRTACQIIDTSR